MANYLAVHGFEGRYEVSDTGIVRSLLNNKITYLVPIVMHRGHLAVSLWDDGGKMYQKFIHRLVLEAFVGPCPDGMMCRHLDGNPTNNELSNLTWGTRNENAQDSVRHGTHHQLRKTHCPQGHPYSGDNLKIYGNRRYCRTCNIERSRAWQEKRRESA